MKPKYVFVRDEVRNAVAEECAAIADKLAAEEVDIYSKAMDDKALSPNGRQAILERALAREGAARRIARDIRALATPPHLANQSGGPDEG